MKTNLHVYQNDKRFRSLTSTNCNPAFLDSKHNLNRLLLSIQFHTTNSQSVSQYMLLWSILPCRNTDTVCLCTVPFSLNGFVPQHALLESLAEDPLRLISLRLLSQLGEKQDKETMWQSISTIWRASAPKTKSTSSWDETTTNTAHHLVALWQMHRTLQHGGKELKILRQYVNMPWLHP